MPTIVRSQHWTIRIDLLPGVAEGLQAYLVQLPVLICVQESGEGDSETANEHLHILAIYPDIVTRPDLTKQMKDHFKDTVFTKSDFAFSVWETYGKDKGMEEYVCKGPSKRDKTPPKVLYKQWLEDEMAHHEAWWAKHYTIVAKKQLKKQKTDVSDEQRMKPVEKIDEQLVQWKTLNQSADRQDIINMTKTLALRYYKGKVNDHVVFPVIQAVLFRHMPMQVMDAFNKRMDDKFKYLY